MGLYSMKILNKKSGFTLSEAMITMSIIGVVATLTISTLGASVQQRARLAEFRAAYAKMETVLRNIILDEGKIYACYSCPTSTDEDDFGLSMKGSCTAKSDQCEAFIDMFVRQMGVTRFCKSNARSEGCIPEQDTKYPSAPNGGCFSNFGKGYVLDYGMVLLRDSDPTILAIDTNGRKGPNKWGQDIFTLQIKAKESTKVKSGASYIKDVGFLPPSSCLPKSGDSSKTSDVLLKDMVSKQN